MLLSCCNYQHQILHPKDHVVNWYQLIQSHYSLKSLSLFALLILPVHSFYYSSCPWVQVSVIGDIHCSSLADKLTQSIHKQAHLPAHHLP